MRKVLFQDIDVEKEPRNYIRKVNLKGDQKISKLSQWSEQNYL